MFALPCALYRLPLYAAAHFLLSLRIDWRVAAIWYLVLFRVRVIFFLHGTHGPYQEQLRSWTVNALALSDGSRLEVVLCVCVCACAFLFNMHMYTYGVYMRWLA